MASSTRRTFLVQAAAAGVSACAAIDPLAVRPTPIGPGVVRGERIKGLMRHEDTILRLGGVGDNWHMTWASDDRQLTSQCDGFGWPGMPGYDQQNQEYHSRLYGVRGNPPDVSFEFIPGYPELVHGVSSEIRWMGNQTSYYNFGVIAVGGRIYQFLSTLNRPLGSAEGASRYIGAKLIFSPDNGITWCNQNGSTPVIWESWKARSRKNMVFFEEAQDAFSLLAVLQMGRNYEFNRDGYVYVYAPNGSVDGVMNELVMFRVPKDRILDRSHYEFFAGLGAHGKARWTRDIESRGVVHTFPRGWVNKTVHPWAWLPSLAYNAPLQLYMMTSWGTACAADGSWFSKPSYLGFWVSPNPWGPWTQIHEETAWMPGQDPKARAYSPIIAPKWIAPDGKSFWLVWTDFQFRDVKAATSFSAAYKSSVWPYYAFNVQRVDFV